MSTLLDREGLGLLVVAVLVVVFLAAGAWFLYHPPQAPDPQGSLPALPTPAEPVAPAVRRPDVVAEIEYPGRDGATVLDLLKEDHQVRLDSELLLFGSIVLEIDTLSARADEFWVFYRDTARGDRSPEVCTTQTGETIRWVLRRRR